MWRRSIRLEGYDYTHPGAYFVTVCLVPRRPLLGTVAHDAVRLSPLGEIVASRLLEVPDHFATIGVDEWIVMPDHVHAVLLVGPRDDERQERARHASPLQVVVGSFKAAATRDVNHLRGTPGAPLWQRGFYDHVVRDQPDLDRVRDYIRTNPQRHLLRSHPCP